METKKVIQNLIDQNQFKSENLLKLKHKKNNVHVDEYEIYSELDFGDGFNAFDDDFYANYMH